MAECTNIPCKNYTKRRWFLSRAWHHFYTARNCDKTLNIKEIENKLSKSLATLFFRHFNVLKREEKWRMVFFLVSRQIKSSYIWHLVKPRLDMVLMNRFIIVWRNYLCFVSWFDRFFNSKMLHKVIPKKLHKKCGFLHHFLSFFQPNLV